MSNVEGAATETNSRNISITARDGGVFVGAMYTQTFISSDINHIINEALKTIPQQSEFYKCIHDVIEWRKKFPNDWKQTWFNVQKKWANDIGCPEGVFVPFNIDAKVNAAYIVIGLLYGDKDFTKSLEIATRCGQDADCSVIGLRQGHRIHLVFHMRYRETGA